MIITTLKAGEKMELRKIDMVWIIVIYVMVVVAWLFKDILHLRESYILTIAILATVGIAVQLWKQK